MHKEGNNYAFIDSQNLHQAILRQGWKLDFRRFRVYLKEKYGVTRAFLFFGYIKSNKQMYATLLSYGYNIIFKPTLKFGENLVKGNIDAELVLHTMIEYQNYNQAIIVTGDGDFYCLVDYLHKQHKLGQILIPNAQGYSSLFKPFKLEKISFMNTLRYMLEYKKPHS